MVRSCVFLSHVLYHFFVFFSVARLSDPSIWSMVISCVFLSHLVYHFLLFFQLPDCHCRSIKPSYNPGLNIYPYGPWSCPVFLSLIFFTSFCVFFSVARLPDPPIWSLVMSCVFLFHLLYHFLHFFSVARLPLSCFTIYNLSFSLT